MNNLKSEKRGVKSGEGDGDTETRTKHERFSVISIKYVLNANCETICLRSIGTVFGWSHGLPFFYP